MLVALLSSQELASDAGSTPRGFLRVGGQSILSRQVSFALNSGCERIICLVDDLSPEIVDIQHRAERAGAVFHAVRSTINLSGMVSIADDLLVISDGLAFDTDIAAAHIGPHRSVLTIAADPAVNTGFERLDRDRAWAGIMVIAGALVEQLAEMPSDIDPQSSLLRLALQNGTGCVAVPDKAVTDSHWVLASSAQLAQNFETKWLQDRTEVAPFIAPTYRLADQAAIAVTKKHPNLRLAAVLSHGGMLVLLSIAGLLGYFGYASIGFGVAALAAFSRRFAGTLSVVLRDTATTTQNVAYEASLLALDAVLVGLCIVITPAHDQIEMGFAAVMVIGLLRVTELTLGNSFWRSWQALGSDRGVLSLGFLGLAFTGAFMVIVQILAVAVLMVLLFQNYRARLTPT